ncbi:MAG TPA: hypothetical protein VF153_01025 [Candidatus Limnocylindria bacterium]
MIDAGRMALIGAAVSVAVLATANTLAGSSPLFVMPLYHLSVYLASRPSFGGPVSMWLPWAVWLALPTIVLIGGSGTALALRMRRLLWSKEARPFVAAFVGFAGLWLTMIALEATIQAYVQYDHFNFMIVGPAALAFGGVLRWLPHRVSAGPSRWPIVAYPLLAILVVVPQALIDPTTVEALSTPVTQKLAAWSLPGAVILGVLAGVVGLGLVATPARYALLLAGLCFGVASAFAVPKQGPFHMAPACHTEQDNFLLVNDVTHWLSSRGLHVTSRSWFPARDVLARPDGCGDFDLYWTYMAIEQAGMLWKLTTPLPERIADLNQGDVRNAAEKERANLVLLSQPGLAEAYKSELATWAQTSRVNPIPRLAETQTFTRGSLSITVQVYRLRQIPRGQARSMPRLPPREGL